MREDRGHEQANKLTTIEAMAAEQTKVKYDYNDEEGLCLEEFIKHLSSTTVGQEYDNIVQNKEWSGTFEASRANNYKNRYPNVKCFDHSRVVLQCDEQDDSDYINANYVDGFRQPKAYISTQGPLSRTAGDFWRMVWQANSRVIVMVTQAFEDGNEKCDIYWPTNEKNSSIKHGKYLVEFSSRDVNDDSITTRLILTNKLNEESRTITHFQFTSWPDFGVPQSATAFLKFRECIYKKQLEALAICRNNPYPPIIVHCSAGIGRTGTFITIDISINRYEETGLINIGGIVKKLRAQRFASIQTREQYAFCYRAIMEYAQS